jgi:DNA-binding YbaB/EbfC family protein
MKQAQRMSEEAERVSAELALVTFRASSGGGAVSVEATGDRKVTKVEIDPELLNPDDCEMLCDMILAATNEALRLADEESQLRMGAVSSRLGLPGM